MSLSSSRFWPPGGASYSRTDTMSVSRWATAKENVSLNNGCGPANRRMVRCVSAGHGTASGRLVCECDVQRRTWDSIA
eukprot:988872-Rhodomonas_salina.4